MKQIQLLWVYHSLLVADGGIKSHSHEYYHLLCVHTGSLVFTLEDSTFSLKPGDTVLVPPNCTHSFVNESSEESTHYYEIKFSILNSALSRALSNGNQFMWSDPLTYQLVKHIADEYVHQRTLSDESASAALSTLAFHLTSEQRLVKDGAPPVIDTTGFNDLSKNVVDYLTNHYSENLTLDDISAGVGLSKNYLCNAFKHNTGTTILDCLNLIRVRKAAELIVYSDLSLAQVAQMCGYISSSHFNRVFSRYAGVPPGQCRRAFALSLSTRGKEARREPGTFMYNVLAGKSISPHTINEFEENNPSEICE